MICLIGWLLVFFIALEFSPLIIFFIDQFHSPIWWWVDCVFTCKTYIFFIILLAASEGFSLMLRWLLYGWCWTSVQVYSSECDEEVSVHKFLVTACFLYDKGSFFFLLHNYATSECLCPLMHLVNDIICQYVYVHGCYWFVLSECTLVLCMYACTNVHNFF